MAVKKKGEIHDNPDGITGGTFFEPTPKIVFDPENFATITLASRTDEAEEELIMDMIVEVVGPSPDSIKCEDWQQEPPEKPWQTVRCRECNTQMWTRMPELHDICEMCGYNIRQQIHDIEQQHIHGRGDRLINPFDGGVFANTASLPPQEK